MSATDTRRYCLTCGTRLVGDNPDSRCRPCRAAARQALVEKPPDVPREFWQHAPLRESLVRERHLGHAIRHYRKHPYHGKKGIPQEIAADWLGISQAQLARIERGLPIEDLGRLIQWATILRVPAELLWFDLPGAGTAKSIPSNSGAWNISADASINPLINIVEWTRDDLSLLSECFDRAISTSNAADIEMLSHAWLSAESPQLIELQAGRRIGDSLISSIEHRVIQLRRADDYMSGRASHMLVRKEIRDTARLLDEASLTEPQARRLLVAIGELAQLAAFVAADAGLYRQAVDYAEGGILAAHGGGDAPLAANIISTLSYQVANTGDPRQAAMLARTAYAGARHSSTATAKALFLERVAWADAKSGDIRSSERALGQVEDNFSRSDQGTDPDWVYWLNREEVDVMAGRCLTELNRPAKAVSLLTDAIAAYDSTHIREISLYQSWLAEDYILLGDIDTAAELASQVLELGVRADSARTDDRLAHLATLIEPFKGVRNAAEFLDRYHEYASDA